MHLRVLIMVWTMFMVHLVGNMDTPLNTLEQRPQAFPHFQNYQNITSTKKNPDNLVRIILILP